MAQELTTLLGDKDLAERIPTVGPIVEPGSTDAFANYTRDERTRWAQVAKEIGLLPE